MKIITHRAIARRTLLRGLGVSVALPLLDSMIPAMMASGKTAATPVRRLGVLYAPNGMIMQSWTPAAEGTAFEFTPTLQPLAPFKDQLLVLSGLDRTARLGGHSAASTGFLTEQLPKLADGPGELSAGVSADQIAAREFSKETQLASLEIGLDARDFVGSCDAGYSCAYTSTISWRGERTPLPMETNPRNVFERLFGDSGSTSAAARDSRLQRRRSILDAVTARVGELERDLGAPDRVKFGEYLDAVRDVERRIQKAEEQSERSLPEVDQPAGIPSTYEAHAKLMFDLQVLAYQCDLTRVISFMFGKEISGRSYPEIGVPDSHHPLSHHQNDREKMEALARVNGFHVSLFAYYLDKLRATADGDGSLLDHVLIMYGAGLADSDVHATTNLPRLLVGGASGQIRGGRHIRFDKGTHSANLLVTMLDKMGVPIDRIGDSDGRVNLGPLSGV